MPEKVRVLILPSEDGEAAWLSKATEHDHPDDLDEWHAEIDAADWDRFQEASRTLGDVITAAVDNSPRDEDGAWRAPCPSFYSWKFDSPLAKHAAILDAGEPSPADLCSRCYHTRVGHPASDNAGETGVNDG